MNSIAGLSCRKAALLCGAISQYFTDIIFLMSVIPGCRVDSKDYSPSLIIKGTEIKPLFAASFSSATLLVLCRPGRPLLISYLSPGGDEG